VSVVLGLRGSGGLVLATDSQGTSAIGNMFLRSNIAKVRLLGDHIAYASVGSQGLAQRIGHALDEQARLTAQRSREDAADIILRIANPLQQQAVERYVPVPHAQPEEWGAIFCGWSPDGPWLLEVGSGGGHEFHERFAATGSVGPFAHLALVSVRHYDIVNQSVEAAQAVAFRAIENACAASASGVNLPVQMAVVTGEGAHVVDDRELTTIEDLVNILKEREVDMLGELAPVAAGPRRTTAAAEDIAVAAGDL
jgi:20S proteasome alpha/beta subunit